MKKIYAVLSALLIALLLVIGTVSVFRKSSQPEKPKVTFSGLLNGKYAAGQRSYYASRFLDFGNLKSTNKQLNKFYKFGGLSGKDDPSFIIDMNDAAAHGGAAIPSKPGPEGQGTKPAGTEPDATAGSAETIETTAPQQTEPSKEPTAPPPPPDATIGTTIIVGDRAMEVPSANHSALSDYAAAVTNISNALGSNVRTFSIAVPNSAEFYSAPDYHSGDNSQKDMISYVYDRLGKDVHAVDAYSKLEAHTDEYIYFRTDHHWTQLGAYYAYSAFCEEAGFKPANLNDFETSTLTNFIGSLYHYLSDYSQAQVLADNPDVLTYYLPIVGVDTTCYSDGSLSDPYASGVVNYIGDDVDNKYLCFLGGDHPITIINTDVGNGKVCMILKESYGNAFTTWLVNHYSKVIAVDPREFNQNGCPSLDLKEFAARMNVNDCIVLNYPMMINSDVYIEWLNRLVR